jgi:preprotein translocase subunit SecA
MEIARFRQEDPKTVYKKEGMKEFDVMWENLQDRVTDSIFRMDTPKKTLA